MSMFAEGLSKIGWDSMVYCSVEIDMIFNVTIMVIIAGIIASVYPAYKALKYDPAEALRME
jgi:ABC-type antimicrobial peptide transport system permease subunit